MKSRVDCAAFKEGALTFLHDTKAQARVSDYADKAQSSENGVLAYGEQWQGTFSLFSQGEKVIC